MVQILPFVGWRYDLSQVGALAEVTTPSRSLIDEGTQRTLYRQHPCNAVRLVMNREEPGDVSPSDQSGRADDFWRLWKREGVLLREHNTAFYIIETTFPALEQNRPETTRWSLIARLRLPDQNPDASVTSVVQTGETDIAQLLELRKTCHASFAPVVGLLEDTTGEDSDPRSLSDHFESVVRLLPPIECIDESGIRHRMWPLTDEHTRTELEGRLAHFSVCIIGNAADYEAAIQHREQLTSSGQPVHPNDAALTVLACLIPSDDPGIQFLPRVQAMDSVSINGPETRRLLAAAKLSCQFIGNDTGACEDAMEMARISDQQPCLAVGTADGEWMTVCPSAGSTSCFDELASQVAGIVSGTADAHCRLQTRKQTSASVCRSLVDGVRQSQRPELLIVQPALDPRTVLSVAERRSTLNDCRLRLYPDVPAGLVFSSLDH